MIVLALMCFIACVFGAVVAILCGAVLLARRRVVAITTELRWRRRLPADWWEEFESDLRAYAGRDWTSAREAERTG